MELSVQQFRTKAEQAYLDTFESAREALPGAGDAFVSSLRNRGIEAYARLGLPHRRIEAWKYTDLRALLTEVYPPIRATALPIDATHTIGPPTSERMADCVSSGVFPFRWSAALISTFCP